MAMTNKFLLLAFIWWFASASLCDLIRALWRVLFVGAIAWDSVIVDALVLTCIVFFDGFFVLFFPLFLEAR